jgi:hypothetical protein
MKIIINLGREILLLGSARESIMTPSETSSEKKFFFCFRPFVNAQELWEVTTKLLLKLNDPVIDVGT